MKKWILLLVLVVIAAVVAILSLFTVNERQYALVFKLGEWQRTVDQPGLHWKLPAPFENVIYLDKRIQTIESADTERIQTSEKKNLIIDSYIKWQIVNPLTFYRAFGGNEVAAQNRLGSLIRDALNASVNTRTVRAVISQERDVVMSEILKTMAQRTQPLGIKVVDVRLKRIEFSPEVSESVYARMRAERKQEANSLRAQGAAESERIRANADRQVAEILANANTQAQTIRGQGDATASDIYAKAYSKDPQFYDFYRSLEAYKNSFHGHKDYIVVDPQSEFFNFFHQSSK